MNIEHCPDPTADIAIGRVMREWKKEVRRNGKGKSLKVRQTTAREKTRVREKRWDKTSGKQAEKTRNEISY